MTLEPIPVEACAGYQGDEPPRRFCRRQGWGEVEDSLDRCSRGAADPEWPIADGFKVAVDDGWHSLRKHDRKQFPRAGIRPVNPETRWTSPGCTCDRELSHEKSGLREGGEWFLLRRWPAPVLR